MSVGALEPDYPGLNEKEVIMCGICGVLSLGGPLGLPDGTPERMIGVMRHRGPDEFGAWRDASIFLGHARLSIIDLAGGQQPMAGPDGRYWITFNGEIFNYIELAAELTAKGHVFRTKCDTEVILHAFLEWGPEGCVDRFNGQFAFAIWDRHTRRLFLARDRFGIRPLFIARHEDKLLFGSEIKALRAYPGFAPDLDPGALAEVSTYWVNIPPLTPFAGVGQLPAGNMAMVGDDTWGEAAPAPLPAEVRVKRYWQPKFLPKAEDHAFVPEAEINKLAGQLREKLVDAATLRLRADVPVGAYLSGGLDSSATAAVIHAYTDHRLKTFSVGFADPDYDETAWQMAMADHLGTEHVTVKVDAEEIARRFRDVVWHTETPILRTAPTPLHALSGLARSEDFKVVLTGEGADEVFAGYNIFREAKVRDFWRRDPGSNARAALLGRLYPYLAQSPPEFMRKFYGTGLKDGPDLFFSHRPRWQNTGPVAGFLVEAGPAWLSESAPEERLLWQAPTDLATYGPVALAQFWEMRTFLAGYLLSSQGDRMLMGNSVEGRFPFLDHTLAEFAGTLPASIKLQSLNEKAILKRSVADLLPADIISRPKQPYRAPDSSSFDNPVGLDLVGEFLETSPEPAADLWQQARVGALTRKFKARGLSSTRDNQAFVGTLSGRILQHDFGPGFESRLAGLILAEGQIDWRNGPDT